MMLNERSEDRRGMTKNKPLLVISNVERNLKNKSRKDAKAQIIRSEKQEASEISLGVGKDGSWEGWKLGMLNARTEGRRRMKEKKLPCHFERREKSKESKSRKDAKKINLLLLAFYLSLLLF